MSEPPAEIGEHYEFEIDEAARLTLGAGQLEPLRTQEIVRRPLPPGVLRILDIGGGAGVHAAWLADDGHEVPLPYRVDRTGWRQFLCEDPLALQRVLSNAVCLRP